MKPDSLNYREAGHISEVIAGWRHVLNKAKNKRRINLLEEQSSSLKDVTVQQVLEVLSCKRGWDFFDEIVQKCSVGVFVKPNNMDSAVYLLAHSVALNSLQRPGAVANLIMEEYDNMEMEQTKSSGTISVLRVHEHKTGAGGSANIVLSCRLAESCKLYFEAICPMFVTPLSENFFFCSLAVIPHGLSSEGLVRAIWVFYVNASDARKVVTTQSAYLDPVHRHD